MKLKNFAMLLAFVSLTALFNSCIQENNVGPQGEPGEVNIYYSQWYTPTAWVGESGDWYFDVSEPAINEDIVEAGIILAYISLPDDVYPGAVRPLPAWAEGANWDFLIPEYGMIEFTNDNLTVPETVNYYFRFVLIPPGTPLKSSKANNLTKEEFMKMPYHEVCTLLGIPE